MKKYLLLVVLTLSPGLSLAWFGPSKQEVRFSEVPVLVLSQDGQPLANMRVEYDVVVTKNGSCRDRDFNEIIGATKDCPTESATLNKEAGETPFVITDANGQALIPAVAVETSGKNPRLSIAPIGLSVFVKDLSCVYAMPLTRWDVRELPPNSYLPVLLNAPVSSLTFINKETLAELNLKDEGSLNIAERVVNMEINKYGETGESMHKCQKAR